MKLCGDYVKSITTITTIFISIWNESVPIQLAQCGFSGLAISSGKILMYFRKKIYGSNFTKQHSETAIV